MPEFFKMKQADIKSWIYYRLPVIAYCGLIFYQSSQAAPDIIPQFQFSDKAAHGIGYFILGALFMRALLERGTDKHIWWLIGLSTLFSGLYGVSDEIHQSFVSVRSASAGDVAADFAGGFLGAAAFAALAAGTRKFGRQTSGLTKGRKLNNNNGSSKKNVSNSGSVKNAL